MPRIRKKKQVQSFKRIKDSTQSTFRPEVKDLAQTSRYSLHTSRPIRLTKAKSMEKISDAITMLNESETAKIRRTVEDRKVTESPGKRSQRLEYLRRRTSQRIATETAEQRFQRLEDMRIRAAKRRFLEKLGLTGSRDVGSKYVNNRTQDFDQFNTEFDRAEEPAIDNINEEKVDMNPENGRYLEMDVVMTRNPDNERHYEMEVVMNSIPDYERHLEMDGVKTRNSNDERQYEIEVVKIRNTNNGIQMKKDGLLTRNSDDVRHLERDGEMTRNPDDDRHLEMDGIKTGNPDERQYEIEGVKIKNTDNGRQLKKDGLLTRNPYDVRHLEIDGVMTKNPDDDRHLEMDGVKIRNTDHVRQLEKGGLLTRNPYDLRHLEMDEVMTRNPDDERHLEMDGLMTRNPDDDRHLGMDGVKNTENERQVYIDGVIAMNDKRHLEMEGIMTGDVGVQIFLTGCEHSCRNSDESCLICGEGSTKCETMDPLSLSQDTIDSEEDDSFDNVTSDKVITEAVNVQFSFSCGKQSCREYDASCFTCGKDRLNITENSVDMRDTTTSETIDPLLLSYDENRGDNVKNNMSYGEGYGDSMRPAYSNQEDALSSIPDTPSACFGFVKEEPRFENESIESLDQPLSNSIITQEEYDSDKIDYLGLDASFVKDEIDFNSKNTGKQGESTHNLTDVKKEYCDNISQANTPGVTNIKIEKHNRIENRGNISSDFEKNTTKNSLDNVVNIAMALSISRNENSPDYIPRFVCPEPPCSYVTYSQARLKNHLQIAHRKVFPCSQCDLVVSSEKVLEAHKLSAHLFHCLHCSFTTKDMGQLMEHKGIHVGEKPKVKIFTCPRCNFKTSSYTELVAHKNITAQKCGPYSCSLCPFTGKHCLSIKKHMERVHKTKEPEPKEPESVVHNYVFCHLCPFSTKTRSLMLKHMRLDHSLGLYFCDVCSYSTALMRDLKTHRSQLHQLEHFVCTDCGQRFSSPSHVQQHTFYKHKKQGQN